MSTDRPRSERRPRPPAEQPRAGKRRDAKRRRRAAIKIQTGDDWDQQRSLLKRAIDEVRFGGHGYIASTGMHLGIIVVLFFWLMPTSYSSEDGGDDGLELTAKFGKLDEKQGLQPVKVTKRKPIFNNPDKRAPIFVKKKGETGNRKAAGKKGKVKKSSVKVKPVSVKTLLRNRDPAIRQKILEEIDPKKKIRRSISYGLAWLMRRQKSAGNWKLYDPVYTESGYQYLNTDTGATALALLAFLGDGHTHKKPGVYRGTVEKGLKWLVGIQKSDGDFHDSVELGRQTAFYAHSQATIVLCEAYVLTKDESLRRPAENGVKFLIRSQNPVNGGWKYQPQEETSRGDLSVTGWALMALHTARSAGIEVPQAAFGLSSRFLDSVQEQNGALYKYEPPPTPRKVSPTMTAEGLLCRQFLGWPREHPAMQEGMAYLKQPEHKPRWMPGGKNRPVVYYWYYAGHVYHNMGDDDWKPWYELVSSLIVAKQTTSPGRKNDINGSWSPKVGKNGGYYGYGYYGGRLYMTTMCLLVLEMPYRHQSIYGESKKK